MGGREGGREGRKEGGADLVHICYTFVQCPITRVVMLKKTNKDIVEKKT